MSGGPVVNRRTAVCGLLVGLLAPGALVACSTAAGGAAPLSAAPGTVLAALSAVPVGGGIVVNGPSGKVLLVQETAGKVVGYDARCPHAGTPVNPPVQGVVVCPNHGSEFNPPGRSTADRRRPAWPRSPWRYRAPRSSWPERGPLPG